MYLHQRKGEGVRADKYIRTRKKSNPPEQHWPDPSALADWRAKHRSTAKEFILENNWVDRPYISAWGETIIGTANSHWRIAKDLGKMVLVSPDWTSVNTTDHARHSPGTAYWHYLKLSHNRTNFIFILYTKHWRSYIKSNASNTSQCMSVSYSSSSQTYPFPHFSYKPPPRRQAC